MTDLFDLLGELQGEEPAWDASPTTAQAVVQWLRWVERWTPGKSRAAQSLCKKCTGSPFVAAAALPSDLPHQVKHALITRLQRVVEKRVDDVTAAELPLLQAELEHSKLWRQSGFDPRAGLAPEYDGIALDPEPEHANAPFLFTLSELEGTGAETETLPQPPLSQAEKDQLRREIDRADAVAKSAGNAVCFALLEHRVEIANALARYVEPQINDLIAELSKHLEVPRDLN